ncbi:MAG TPA: hypothetical protein VMV43_00660 [Candidatus Nanopelagicaceae bacterium]|nr:hypothetical protein [Candidatus Nanopelagicaceae bacterium]
MPWKISIYFYLSLGCSLCGLIFPTHVTQAIGFDIGDMIHWVYGFSILIPRNPVGEPKLYFSFLGVFLLVSAIVLLRVYFVQLRNAKLGNRYDKNRIYIIAVIQLMVFQFYINYGRVVLLLSIWGFMFGAIFAIIGNKELNLFYIRKGIVNARNERILGVVLITMSLILTVYIISIFLCCVVPFITDLFFLSFVIDMFPTLIMSIIMIFYGILSLKRAKRKNKSNLK